MTTVSTTPTSTSNLRSERTARSLGTASVMNDDFPTSCDVGLFQDVSVEEATDQEATDRLVFEIGADTT